jgi:hypothetical protein
LGGVDFIKREGEKPIGAEVECKNRWGRIITGYKAMGEPQGKMFCPSGSHINYTNL